MTVLPRHEEEARTWLSEHVEFLAPLERQPGHFVVNLYKYRTGVVAALIAAAEERIWLRAEKVCKQIASEQRGPLACARAIRAAKEMVDAG